MTNFASSLKHKKLMKLLQFSFIRAIAAAVVGILLLKYDAAVLKGITIALGIMFLIAGLVSLVGWLMARRQKPEFKAYDNGQESEESRQQMFPIVGLGSVLLGCILSLTQTDMYLTWAMYLIGAVLILGALNLMLNINAARKLEPVANWLWLPPCAIILASVVAMLRGLVPPETTTTILGITAIVYAVVELYFSFQFYQIKRRYDKTQAQVKKATGHAAAEDAEIVPVE